MNRIFHARPLTVRDARRAFPLAAMAEAGLSARSWSERIRTARSGQSGLMMLEDARGLVHGLFRYEIAQGAQKCLRVTNVILAQLGGGQIRRDFSACLEDMAHKLGCEEIRLEDQRS